MRARREVGTTVSPCPVGCRGDIRRVCDAPYHLCTQRTVRKYFLAETRGTSVYLFQGHQGSGERCTRGGDQCGVRVAAGPLGGRAVCLLMTEKSDLSSFPFPVPPHVFSPPESLPGIRRLLPLQDHLLVDHRVRPGPLPR